MDPSRSSGTSKTQLVYVIFLTLVDGSLLFELYVLSLFVELLPMEIFFSCADAAIWCFNGVFVLSHFLDNKLGRTACQ